MKTKDVESGGIVILQSSEGHEVLQEEFQAAGSFLRNEINETPMQRTRRNSVCSALFPWRSQYRPDSVPYAHEPDGIDVTLGNRVPFLLGDLPQR